MLIKLVYTAIKDSIDFFDYRLSIANRLNVDLVITGEYQNDSSVKITAISDNDIFENALKTAEEIMRFIDDESKQMSRELAVKRGPFPSFDKSRYSKQGQKPLRNATTTTIAPTGVPASSTFT